MNINYHQIGFYLVVAGTAIAAGINSIAPLFSPQVAGILTVISLAISALLNKGAVNKAVALASKPTV